MHGHGKEEGGKEAVVRAKQGGSSVSEVLGSRLGQGTQNSRSLKTSESLFCLIGPWVCTSVNTMMFAMILSIKYLEIRYSGASTSVLFAQVILTIQFHHIYSHLKDANDIQLGKPLNKRCWKSCVFVNKKET